MELIFCCVKERDDLMVNIIKQEIDIEEALKKQTRDDRTTDNYFNKISNDAKHDLACEKDS